MFFYKEVIKSTIVLSPKLLEAVRNLGTQMVKIRRKIFNQEAYLEMHTAIGQAVTAAWNVWFSSSFVKMQLCLGSIS